MVVVAINDNWKMPIGYFLVDKLNSSQKEELTQHSLSLLHEYKAKVVSVTFDGLSSNLGMMKNLGCDLIQTPSKQHFCIHLIQGMKLQFFWIHAI